MAQLGVVGAGAGIVAPTPKQLTITERLANVREALRNSHGRLNSAVSRAGLLVPTPTAGEKPAQETSDLNSIVLDIEHLCEKLTQDCSEVEKIA